MMKSCAKKSGWIKMTCAFVLMALLWVGLTVALPQARAEGTHSVTLDEDDIKNNKWTSLGYLQYTDEFLENYNPVAVPEGETVTLYVYEDIGSGGYSLTTDKPEYYYSELFNIVITASTSTKEIEITQKGNIFSFIMPDEDVSVHGEYVFHSFCCRTRKGRCPNSDDYFHHFVLTNADALGNNDKVLCECKACGAMMQVSKKDGIYLAHFVDSWQYGDGTEYDWGKCWYCGQVVQREHVNCIHNWEYKGVDWENNYTLAVFHFYCSLCEGNFDSEVRNIKYEGTKATCTERGAETYTAMEVESGLYQSASIFVETPPTGHLMYWSDILEPSYNADGHAEGWTCLNCGKHFRDEEGNEEIPAGEWILPKNCPFSGSGTESDPWQIDAPFITRDSGWYEMIGDVTLSERISVIGDVHLILGAGTTLTASKGVTVTEGNSLTISGSGTLIADASGVANAAGIGGDKDGSSRQSGFITINGGTIVATGGNYGAGIGGGMCGYCYDVTINGGTVTATGGTRAAGIGGGGNLNWNGQYGNVATITINGGTIKATGKSTGSGIGAGGGSMPSSGGISSFWGGSGGDSNTIKGGNVEAVIINGGRVTASSPDGAGIGPDRYYGSGNVVLGWSAESDFIEASSCSGTVSFRQGRSFVLEGTDTVATLENLDGQRLVPYIPAFGDADFVLPADILVIEDNAFEGDQGIISVEIQANCEQIGKEAFKDCLYLVKIRIPAGCSVGEDAFAGCGWVLVYGAENSSAWDYCQAHPENTQFVAE